MDIDPQLRDFLTSFRTIAELAARTQAQDVPLLVDALTEHLGVPATQAAVVAKEIVAYRYADYDVALERMAGPDAGLLGLGGGDQRHHMSLADMIGADWARVPLGQVDWTNVPINATETRRALSLGIRLFSYQGQPVAVLQRRRSRMHGNGTGVIEVLCADADVANALLEEATTSSTRDSLLRGNIISLELSGFEGEGDGYRFLPRPHVGAEDVILPPGVLDRVSGHVVGIAEHAATLRAHGQHLKRGVLLYGPPGTGKTHTVRHLLSVTPGHTAMLLSGATLQMVGQATAIARHLQPAILVLEDCDLVAMQRDLTPGGNPLLFEVLDAIDGLAADADVAFLLTTNRVDVLEEALAQRPGRVDLSVEIPLPDEAARRRLLELYGRAVGFGAATLDDLARRSDERTASFFKELVRRAVLYAAEAGEEPADAHLVAAFEALQADRAELQHRTDSGFYEEER
ncbi:AAA family ATPase [Nigerium massiliense]|uniref:AAA family ATPase n=1 Tax=Nigerium massiliense TaxID=1522317 RepID=UPI0006934E2C|nr:AAA family ATPase [Nigerium massiliense]